jgi:Na+-translocating ferredoxin:NAD+ oxidoreductase subunit G
MMNKGRQITVTGLLLMVFAIIGGTMVGITYESTADKIADNKRRAMLRNLNQILPTSSYDNDLITDTLVLEADDRLGQEEKSIAYLAKKDNKIVAIVFSAIAPDGYNGAIKLLVGVNTSGTLAGVRVVYHNETPGLGDSLEAKRSNWIFDFNNKSLKDPDLSGWQVKRDGGVFDQFTGATITPRAVVKAVHHSLIYFDRNKDKLLGITKKS